MGVFKAALCTAGGTTLYAAPLTNDSQATVKMPSLAAFCWAILVLVEGPLGGTCQEDHRPTSSFQCGPSDQGLACANGMRCCREGHLCSADSMWCFKSESVVLCGDKVSECPNGSTCCETPQGTWGCCPLPKAVCCEDKEHCCPGGSLCDVRRSVCVSPEDGEDMPMWSKLPARRRADWENQRANMVPCDDKSYCRDGTTCCKTAQGDWSCCPLPQAVCCSDFLHCCPQGHTCNLFAQTCDLEWRSVPWLKKEAAESRQQEQEVRCDDTLTCSDSSTCCKTQTGSWGCCPLPRAVCCPDGTHCCPTDYTCDEEESKCVKGQVAIPWYPKLPASISSLLPSRTTVAAMKPGFVQCDDQSLCNDGQTCCKISPTDWGCCPFANAVCCSDMQHCCQAGYRCTLRGQCTSNGGLPWL